MSAAEITARHDPGSLRGFAAALFGAAGMEAEKAQAVADILVEADMLGHDTHGLALAPRYLDAIEAGAMKTTGEPEVVNDRGACVTWNGRLLPGPWLVLRAMALAIERAAAHGLCAVAIGNSHHIGCLAAYLPRAAERGMVLSIHSSAPGVATVAPFGGTRAALSPAPFAFGFPTGGDPVMIDVSASITTNNMAMRLAKEGSRYPRPWLMDAEGQATDDPTVLQRGGTVLPAGGQDHGQKGYGWGLTAEALSQGLSGHGRADGPKGMTNAVFLQVFDPAAFAGLDAFNRQAGAITANCRSSPPRPGQGAVRLPGEAGLRRRAAAERDGVMLRDGILDALAPWAAKLGVGLP
ncbi:Ldh family oxidoreductase [Roseomonas sp. SSH11]|uniref:Ldh family oxidoreductase n=1 Tax=Pararoseomonas baculiformis TaxID=2820812 RepID=A0ABS4AJU9_9PROT|nr:Ldh family oxidoreductase [Pararoseomonas baculiformis]MBP0447297.1 Ldh family oxidoreductase [Pararoseomonas baculiformis]